MTQAMKFNRKVYVVPHEKYEGLLESLRKAATNVPGRQAATTAIGSGACLPSDLLLSQATKMRSPAISAELSIDKEGPPVARESKTTALPPTSGYSASSSSSSSSFHEIDSRLNSQILKNRANAIFYMLTCDSQGISREKPQTDYTGLLLHTQSEEFPVPPDHHKLYWILLERDVPLHLISNVKLRRILHYMKNKYWKRTSNAPSEGMTSEDEGEEGEEEEEEEEEEDRIQRGKKRKTNVSPVSRERVSQRVDTSLMLPSANSVQEKKKKKKKRSASSKGTRGKRKRNTWINIERL